MKDFNVEVEVAVEIPGEIGAKLRWNSGQQEIEAHGLREAAIEGLRQAIGDAMLELGLTNGGQS